jgi:RNA polymerase sigma-70 factor (ECF subfamily)
MAIDSTEESRAEIDAAALISAAHRGSNDALGKLLQEVRPYLLVIARQEMGQQLAGKVAPSDLVQETIVGACQSFNDFRGWTRDELLAWLRTILLNELANTRRHFATSKRDVAREQGVAPEGLVAGQCSASSAFRSLQSQERLEQALTRLPELYRQVILLRHRENLSFAQIGQMLQRSEGAVHKLWTRAVQQLRNELPPDE